MNLDNRLIIYAIVVVPDFILAICYAKPSACSRGAVRHHYHPWIDPRSIVGCLLVAPMLNLRTIYFHPTPECVWPQKRVGLLVSLSKIEESV